MLTHDLEIRGKYDLRQVKIILQGKLSAAKPGCRARFLFGYFLFCASKEKVTRRKGEINSRVSEDVADSSCRGSTVFIDWKPWVVSYCLSRLLVLF